MSGSGARRVRRSQRASLRPGPANDDEMRTLAPVLISGQWHDRASIGAVQYVRVPGVAAHEDRPSVPDRWVRFLGLTPCVEVNLRQENRLLELGTAPAGSPPQVAAFGVTVWSVSLDGVTVYAPPLSHLATATVAEALAEASVAVTKLLAHPVRWQEPEEWLGRACAYQGVPARIRNLLPLRGMAALEADPGHAFPPEPGDPLAGSPTVVLVDLLSDRVRWSEHHGPHGPTTEAGTSPGDTGGESHG